MVTINVIIVSYNQEKVISRCLNSILSQKEYGLNNVIICDDCSKDKTWGILQDYQKKHPDIIKPIRNEHNLGIYPNFMKSISLRGEADLYYQMAGDDALCEGWFKAVQDFIKYKKIDFSQPIGLYCDWKMVDTDGKEIVMKQEKVSKGLNPYSLYLRGLLSGRSMLVNDEVIKRYEPAVLEGGLRLAESTYDAQPHLLIKDSFYLPFVASIYYSGRGVSVDLNKEESDYKTTQVIIACNYHIKHYIKDIRDKYYELYCIESANYNMKPNLSSFVKALYFFHKGKLKGLNYSIKDYLRGIRPLFRPLARKLHIV